MLNIVDNTDRFHEEPWVTIKRINNTIERNNKIKENINSKENIKDSDLHQKGLWIWPLDLSETQSKKIWY